MDINQLVQTVLIYALPVVFAITVHEAAHGYAARYLGDNTAWMMGRVTLNPIKHIDPIGTIAMPLLLAFLTDGKFVFGYAKPVPVNFNRLNHPKRDMVWVALAGPASNIVQAILWALAFGLLVTFGIREDFFLKMCTAGVVVNLVLWALNLFPLPPLDGGRVLAGLLPRGGAQELLSRIEPYGFFIVIGLLYIGFINEWWLTPLVRFGADLINGLLHLLGLLPN